MARHKNWRKVEGTYERSHRPKLSITFDEEVLAALNDRAKAENKSCSSMAHELLRIALLEQEVCCDEADKFVRENRS